MNKKLPELWHEDGKWRLESGYMDGHVATKQGASGKDTQEPQHINKGEANHQRTPIPATVSSRTGVMPD